MWSNVGGRDPIPGNGGVVGGRILRDKLFFFGRLQVTQERANPFTTATLPTTAARGGDLSFMLSNACRSPITINSAYTTAPGSNVLTQAALNQVSQSLPQYIPLPTDNVCGNTNVTRPQSDTEYRDVGCIGFQHSSKDAINFRYFVSDY